MNMVMNIQVRDVYQLPLTMVGEREACLGAALAIFDRFIVHLIISFDDNYVAFLALPNALAIFDRLVVE